MRERGFEPLKAEPTERLIVQSPRVITPLAPAWVGLSRSAVVGVIRPLSDHTVIGQRLSPVPDGKVPRGQEDEPLLFSERLPSLLALSQAIIP
jgi:hypothetical protein